MKIKIKLVPDLLKLAGKICPIKKYIKMIHMGDKELDKLADKEREVRADIVDEIRKASSIILLLLCVGGCVTVENLRDDGYTVTRWQATRLNISDFIIGSDDIVDAIMDYEINIDTDKPSTNTCAINYIED
jgi:hypothetical protein